MDLTDSWIEKKLKVPACSRVTLSFEGECISSSSGPINSGKSLR
jgi:hypothetical protein